MKSNLNNCKKEYYLTTLDNDGKYIVFDSIFYKLSELDILMLIKICLIERRNAHIGKKIMEMYRNSYDEAESKLNTIGIPNDKKEPTRISRPKTKQD